VRGELGLRVIEDFEVMGYTKLLELTVESLGDLGESEFVVLLAAEIDPQVT